MSFQILPATSADVNTLIDIYFLAFQNPLARAVFPDIPPVRAWWTKMISEEILEPSCVFLKAIDADSKTIVAWAKWNKPGAKIEDVSKIVWPDGSDADICNRFFGDMFEKHKFVMQDRPHWYLELLATHPNHQRRGAGYQLLRHTLDQEAHPAYLEASPQSVLLYHKIGFVEKEKVVINLGPGFGGDYMNLCMVREPKQGEEIRKSASTQTSSWSSVDKVGIELLENRQI